MPEEYKENPVQSYPGIEWALKRWEKGYIIPPTQRRIYDIIAAQYQGKPMVDIGSSFGVGANILSHRALSVWAIDISEDLVKFGRALFASPKLSLDVYDILNPPTRPHYAFDVILFLEIIEHIPRADWDKAMNNLKRFFKEDSVGFISTPNRNSDKIDKTHPHNTQHTYEAPVGELYEFLIKHFRSVTLYSVAKLNSFEQSETIDGNSKDTPVLAKIEGVIPVG